jgi:hypothetical protein
VPGADWHDPFAEDEAARERECRRAEREARRRGTQAGLGEKVAVEQQTAVSQPQRSADPPARAGAAAAAGDGAGPAAAVTPTPQVTPPETHVPPAVSSRRRPRSPFAGDPLLVRRLIGGLILAVAAAIVAVAIGKVIDRLEGSDPPPAVIVQKPTSAITIPEGLDRRQIAELAKQSGIKGDYLEATKKPPKGFDLDKYGASDAPNLEGFLFPDTWDDLPKKPNVHDLVGRQLTDFQQQIKGIDMSYAKSKNLTVYDVVKIASMIEREIQVPEERKLAAAVIYNRLAANNPLGMDSTIRYYLQNYDEQLTESELAEDEPYNTRIHPGLPPTPISNPGADSLEAAANPARSDVFYFVIKPGTCNEHRFVKTEDEFLAAEEEYQQALQAEGGSPTEC